MSTLTMTSTEKLPININASKALCAELMPINSVINRLEAQFNFQTMTANWYGDEEEIIDVDILLVMPEHFVIKQAEQRGEQGFKSFSDDVFSVHDLKKQTCQCLIAITPNELTLLTQENKLLAPYLQKKLYKVLTLIGQQLGLPVLKHVD